MLHFVIRRTVLQVWDAGGREWGWLREGSIPLRFQGGVAAPINKSPRSSVAQTGWFVNSNKNKVRYADIYKEATRPFTNHPSAPLRNGDFLLRRSHPSLKTEVNEVASRAVIDFEIASLVGQFCLPIFTSWSLLAYFLFYKEVL